MTDVYATDPFGNRILLPIGKERFSRKFMIYELQRVAEENPEKIISRDFFRKDDTHLIREVDYTAEFGTWSAFKIAAGLQPTRTIQKEIRAFARHSEVSELRDYNHDKNNLKDIHKRESDDRFQTFLVGSDQHDIECDPFYRRMFIEAARSYNPSKIIFNGDLYDMYEFSSYKKRPANLRIGERVLWVRNFMAELRNMCPDAEFNMVEGNHEYRFIRHIIENSPYLAEVLDINGYNIKKVLGLDEFEVNYYANADLGTFTDSDINNELRNNYYLFRDFVMFYHYPKGKEQFHMPGVSGHHHKYQVWPMHNITYGSFKWMQIGGGAKRKADYTDAASKWQNGFGLVHVDLNDKKNTIFEYIDCTYNACRMNGKTYFRTETEKLVVPHF